MSPLSNYTKCMVYSKLLLLHSNAPGAQVLDYGNHPLRPIYTLSQVILVNYNTNPAVNTTNANAPPITLSGEALLPAGVVVGVEIVPLRPEPDPPVGDPPVVRDPEEVTVGL